MKAIAKLGCALAVAVAAGAAQAATIEVWSTWWADGVKDYTPGGSGNGTAGGAEFVFGEAGPLENAACSDFYNTGNSITGCQVNTGGMDLILDYEGESDPFGDYIADYQGSGGDNVYWDAGWKGWFLIKDGNQINPGETLCSDGNGCGPLLLLYVDASGDSEGGQFYTRNWIGGGISHVDAWGGGGEVPVPGTLALLGLGLAGLGMVRRKK